MGSPSLGSDSFVEYLESLGANLGPGLDTLEPHPLYFGVDHLLHLQYASPELCQCCQQNLKLGADVGVVVDSDLFDS